MAAGGERIPLMRVLLLTLDGASVQPLRREYSRIICSTLNAAGSAVLLVCGRPKASPERFPFPHDRALFQGITVPVARWFKHDRGCAHEEYCAGVEAAGEAIAAFGPDAVVAVDWVGSLAHRRIWHLIPSVPVVWLNFRVFHTSHNIPPEDIPFYQEAEAVACRAASHAVALCRMDATVLESNAAGPAPFAKPVVLLTWARGSERRAAARLAGRGGASEARRAGPGAEARLAGGGATGGGAARRARRRRGGRRRGSPCRAEAQRAAARLAGRGGEALKRAAARLAGRGGGTAGGLGAGR
eukprot:tig00000806_g4361.t1